MEAESDADLFFSTPECVRACGGELQQKGASTKSWACAGRVASKGGQRQGLCSGAGSGSVPEHLCSSQLP
jgi:hypothetical protein